MSLWLTTFLCSNRQPDTFKCIRDIIVKHWSFEIAFVVLIEKLYILCNLRAITICIYVAHSSKKIGLRSWWRCTIGQELWQRQQYWAQTTSYHPDLCLAPELLSSFHKKRSHGTCWCQFCTSWAKLCLAPAGPWLKCLDDGWCEWLVPGQQSHLSARPL